MRSAVRPSKLGLGGIDTAGATALPPYLILGGMLLAGFVLRLLLIGAEGFHGDVSSFESWSLTLADHPMRDFYTQAGFADYPPGYFFILWFIGHAYRLLVHSDPNNYFWLKVFVKLPAIVMDLVNAFLAFTIVRRYAMLPWAFAAAALVAFNPSTVFISAYWGQVDSVAAGLTLFSLLLMFDAAAQTGRRQTGTIVAAWLVLSYSVLIKPPAVVIAPLFLVFAFTTSDPKERVNRLLATWYGVLAGLFLAYLAALAFNPGLNPIAQFAWLIKRYAYAAGVYPYNSVNAFNLYEIFFNSRFWDSDATILPGWHVGGMTVGMPQYAWGVTIFIAATLLVISRFVQRRDQIALLESAMILSLGYFVLSTRMHERYIFNAMMLAIPLAFYKRRYLYSAVILTFTLLANLYYSLDYLHVMDAKIPNVDPANLHPFLSHFSSLANVAVFFYLGYAYLGTGEDVLENFNIGAYAQRVGVRLHNWFSPLEGIVAMTRLDWLIASCYGVFSFVLSYVDYQWPSEKIFDEIYYARAGEEYLTHKEIFEFTHPPLTKLWITLSMVLFGGMHGAGDTSWGWRFLNLVMGGLMVFVLYVFAKRLLGSTMFASIAAGLLLFDGFHYVQTRIATPEITVAFFVLLTLYTFYRYWLSCQVRVFAPPVGNTRSTLLMIVGVGAVVSVGFAILVAHGDFTTGLVAFLYLLAGIYTAARLLVSRFVPTAEMVSYAEGSRITNGTLETLDGGKVPGERGALVSGESTSVDGNALVHAEDGLRIEYARGGAVSYATADATAQFSPAGTLKVGDATIDGRRDNVIWLFALAASAGCLAASKWNGLFDFFVVWGLAIFVTSQRYWAQALRGMGVPGVLRRPATWGNPFGFSLDLLVAAMLFVGGTIYVLCYIPYFGLGHNLADLVGLQKQMFGYHYDLTATHPYGSKWWQWPIIGRPISYYYHDWRTGADLQNNAACCVAEILALPNPLNWWSGLVTVPLLAWLGARERNKGYLLLVVAYFLQWLPWTLSPRVAFEYHFFPNLAIICLANTVVLQRLWFFSARFAQKWSWPKIAVLSYCAAIVGIFIFFFPILAGLHVTWNTWDARMLHWLVNYNWV